MSDDPRDELVDDIDEEDKESPQQEISEARSKSSVEEIIGVSESDLQVHSLILTLGNVTKGDLALMSGMNLEKINDSITHLISNKMVTELPGVVPRYQAVPPFDKLSEEVKSITDGMEQLRNDMKEELKSASTAIRDSLLKIAHDNLVEVHRIEEQIKISKGETSGKLSDILTSFEKESKQEIEKMNEALNSSFSEWKETTETSSNTSITKIQDQLSSTGGAVTSEMRSWVSLASESSETMKSNMINQINIFIEKIDSDLKQKNTELREAVGNTFESLTTSFSDNSSSLQNEFENLKTQLEEIVRSLADLMSTKTKETSNNIDNSIRRATDEIGNSLDIFGNNINSIVAQAESSEEQTLASLEAEVDSISSNLKTDTSSAIERHRSVSEELVDTFGHSATSAIDSINKQNDTLESHAITTVESTINSVRDVSDNGIQRIHDRVAELSEGMVEEVTKVLATNKASFNGSIENTQNTMQNINRKALTTSSDLLGNTRSSLTSQLETISTNARDRIDQMLTEVKTSVFDEIERTINSAKQNLDSSISEELERIRIHYNDLDSRIISEMASQREAHHLTIDQLVDSVQTEQNTLMERVDSEKHATLDELRVKLDQHNNESKISINGIASESNERIEGFSHQLDSTISSLKNRLNETESELNHAIMSGIDNLIQATEALSTSMRNKSSQVKEEVRTAIDANLVQNKEHIHSTLTSSASQLNQELSEISMTAATDISNIGDRGKTQLGEISTLVQNNMINAVSEAKSSQNEFEQQLDDAISKLTNTLSEHMEGLKTEASDTVDNFAIQARATTDSKAVAIESAFTAVANEISSASNSMVKSTIQNAEESRKGTATMVNSIHQSLISKLNEYGRDAQDATVKGFDTLYDRGTDLKNALSSMQTNLEKDEMIGLSESQMDKAFAGTKGAEVPGAEVATLLSKVWERVGATDFPGAKQTWTIVTRAAVLAHIKDMLQRAKSKVTLIVPNPLEVPTQILTELKTTIGVEVVVTEGNLGPVKPLVGRGNIRLRTRSERDVYACVRDSEEVLLAPAAPSDTDVVGVATEEEGFIKFIMSIIGPIFQAKTKLIREGDI